MQNSAPLGVLIVGKQSNETAQHDFEKLMSSVSHGEMKGVIFDEQVALDGQHASVVHRHVVRKGALWGAGLGLILGLAPLLTSILIAAGAGALIGKASELRIEGASPPRLRFARRGAGEQHSETG
jgi:hypothetical protein